MIGERCSFCRPGTFGLRKSDADGCSECFCFHMTDRCRSSNWPVQTYSFDEQSWRVNDPNGKVFTSSSDGKIVYTVAGIDQDGSGLVVEGKQPKSVYFEAPIPRADYTRAYGLHLVFTISSVPTSDRARSDIGADVKLVNFHKYYWLASCKTKKCSGFQQDDSRILGRRTTSKCQFTLQSCCDGWFLHIIYDNNSHQCFQRFKFAYVVVLPRVLATQQWRAGKSFPADDGPSEVGEDLDQGFVLREAEDGHSGAVRAGAGGTRPENGCADQGRFSGTLRVSATVYGYS